MIKIGSVEREFARLLFSHEAVDLYDLHERYRLSPGQVARVVRHFASEGIVNLDGDRVALTAVGRLWILKNREFLFMKGTRREWADLPGGVKREPRDASEPYMPRLSSVNVRFFERH